MEKTYVFDFNIQDWCKWLEIEASSKEEAIKKFQSMSTEDIVSKGIMYNVATVTDLDISYVTKDGQLQKLADGTDIEDYEEKEEE